MRLSIDEIGVYDEDRQALTLRAKIYLDGKFIEKCVTADEEQGYIVVYISPEDPRFAEELQKQKQALDWPKETLYGSVKIVDPYTEKDSK